jgi:hypothetical protein
MAAHHDKCWIQFSKEQRLPEIFLNDFAFTVGEAVQKSFKGATEDTWSKDYDSAVVYRTVINWCKIIIFPLILYGC